MLEPGLSYTQEMTVELKDTAAVYGSGKLNVTEFRSQFKIHASEFAHKLYRVNDKTVVNRRTRLTN